MIVTPGITIRDRLRVLLPNDPENYYRQRDIVPPHLQEQLGQVKIVITNFHAFQLREKVAAGKLTKSIVTEGQGSPFTETPAEMVRRVCRELSTTKQIIVLNDEAHHCYRHKPDGEEDPLTGDERVEAKMRDEADFPHLSLHVEVCLVISWRSVTISSPAEESVRPDQPTYRSQVLDHLGLVAGRFDELGMGDVIDQATQQHPEMRDLTAGEAVKAMVLNGRGWINQALDLVPRFVQNKPTYRLISPRVAPDQLNDDALGRALETLDADGVTARYRLLAATAAERLGLTPRLAHLERPSVHGRWTRPPR